MNLPLKQYAHLLAMYLKPQWRRVLLLAVLLLGTIGLQLVNPQLLRFFIDTARAGGATRTLLQAALAFIGVALVQQFAAIAGTYVSETVGWTATNALRRERGRITLKPLSHRNGERFWSGDSPTTQALKLHPPSPITWESHMRQIGDCSIRGGSQGGGHRSALTAMAGYSGSPALAWLDRSRWATLPDCTPMSERYIHHCSYVRPTCCCSAVRIITFT